MPVPPATVLTSLRHTRALSRVMAGHVLLANQTQVSKGLDKRTTIMIRNIPNKYTQAMLLQEIDASYRGSYDFFYLPIDFKNKCNVGYAFINFMDYRRIVPFFREFNGQRWKNFNSEKVEADLRFAVEPIY